LDFLEACQDVVKALKSLYQEGKILHRDIAVKNLIIASQCRERDAKGVLIDLDIALDLEKGTARKGQLVGSEGFMAIGILSSDPHTHQHDLESLFYVFLWVAICNHHEHNDQESLRYQPETSQLWG
jgi:serine/threonine protein kinase